MIDYQVFMMIGFILIQSLTAAKYIMGLNTRIAVLEAGHNKIDEDLREIKADVKKLLLAVTS
ncbi:MAG: hypothetical protein ACYTKD_28615 [Planctomycetota bacterium]|jgi:hypothetical protein